MLLAARERREPALYIAAVSDPDNIKFASESGRYTLHSIGRQRPRQAMQRGFVFTVALKFGDAVLLHQRDAVRDRNGLFALRPFDVQMPLAGGDLHALRQREQLFPYSRHTLPF